MLVQAKEFDLSITPAKASTIIHPHPLDFGRTTLGFVTVSSLFIF
jgi:hypothetical protein